MTHKAKAGFLATLATATLLAVSGCASTSPTTTDPGPTTSDTPSQTTTPREQHGSEAPNPDAKYSTSIDYLLNWDDNMNTDYRFIATAKIHNVGNVGLVVKVKAAWPQVGHRDYVLTKTVKVPVGATKAVHFDQKVGQEEVDRLQASNYDDQGKVTVKYLDWYGTVKG